MRLRERVAVALVLILPWALAGCVVTGGGEARVTVGLGREGASRPEFREPAGHPEDRGSLEFFEDQ